MRGEMTRSCSRTRSSLSDFIFECEMKIDWTLNTGMQTRSAHSPDYKEGRVYGYQVEIDASGRAWTGGEIFRL